jgi:hypothetical protein
MRTNRNAYKWLVTAVRWLTRLSGIVMAALILIVSFGHIQSGEGMPNPFTEPLAVTLETVGFLVCLAGLIIAWRWARLGGVLILAGMLTFHIIECKVWLNWVFLVLELVGFGHLCTWVLSRRFNDFSNRPHKN